MKFEGLTPVSYEVTVVVEEGLVDALERYLPGHIADVMATGAFTRATLERIGTGRYRTRYEAPSQASLDRYLAEDAPPLRADFIDHFPDGVSVSREVWSEVYRHEVETK
jgi:hypothetical protein